MSKHNFVYFAREGAYNMFNHGFMSFAAIGITVACLLIMGTFTLVAVNANAMLKDMETENQVLAYVEEGYTEEEAEALVEGCYVEISPHEDFSDAIAYPLVKCSGNEGYRALTDGLYATEYSDAFYFRVVTPEGQGTAISYSVETYAYRQTSPPDSTSVRLMAAMILFGDAARAYEASLSAEIPA